MSRHSTGLYEHGRRCGASALRAELVRTLELHDGNVLRTAAALNVHRRWLYRLIVQHDLWPVVDRARAARRAKPPEVERALAALR